MKHQNLPRVCFLSHAATVLQKVLLCKNCTMFQQCFMQHYKYTTLPSILVVCIKCYIYSYIFLEIDYN